MQHKDYNRIKIVLVEKKVTNKELAKALGKSESTVSRWCTNDMQPPIPVIYKIADFLNVDARDLLIGTK